MHAVVRGAEVGDTPLPQEHGVRTHAFDCVRAVADEQKCQASLTQVPKSREASMLKSHITHGEDFVDKQDIRLNMHGHRERKAGSASATVSP